MCAAVSVRYISASLGQLITRLMVVLAVVSDGEHRRQPMGCEAGDGAALDAAHGADIWARDI